MEGVPAYVWGRRSDVLAWNQTASALFGDWTARAPQERNWARITFLDPASRKLFTDWESKAYDVVGQLRLGAGLHSDDALLASLIGELSMKSEDFRRLWAAHDVKKKTHGTMRLSHPLVGELTLRYETLALPGDQEQSLTTYHAKPGSPSEEALRLLASWGGGRLARAPCRPPQLLNIRRQVSTHARSRSLPRGRRQRDGTRPGRSRGNVPAGGNPPRVGSVAAPIRPTSRGCARCGGS